MNSSHQITLSDLSYEALNKRVWPGALNTARPYTIPTWPGKRKERKLFKTILYLLYYTSKVVSIILGQSDTNLYSNTLFTRVRTNFRTKRIFYLCNFTRNCANRVTDCSNVYHLKTCTVPRVPCKRKAHPCKCLSVQKFVRTRENGVWVCLKKHG